MKRMTYRLEDQYGNPTDSIILESDLIFLNSSEKLKKVLSRLAAIEDILGDEYDLNRLRELVQTDREGKIPKYTIGDTIYDRFGDAWEVTAVERRLLAGEPKWIYRCGHIGTNDYCALWEFEVLTHAEAQAALRREQDGE